MFIAYKFRYSEAPVLESLSTEWDGCNHRDCGTDPRVSIPDSQAPWAEQFGSGEETNVAPVQRALSSHPGLSLHPVSGSSDCENTVKHIPKPFNRLVSHWYIMNRFVIE